MDSVPSSAQNRSAIQSKAGVRAIDTVPLSSKDPTAPATTQTHCIDSYGAGLYGYLTLLLTRHLSQIRNSMNQLQ